MSTFPPKLHKLLSNPEFSHIIGWMPHGRSWRVFEPDIFSKYVLPKYFSQQSKYSSFMRQVNGWGFKRITRGPDRNSYYHKLFVRDNPELAPTMSRRGSWRSITSVKKDEDIQEPNFYEMTGLGNNSRASARSMPTTSAGIPSQLYGGSDVPSNVRFNSHDKHIAYGIYERSHVSLIFPHQFYPSQSIDPSLTNTPSLTNGSFAPSDNYSNYPSKFNFSATTNAWSNPYNLGEVGFAYPLRSSYDSYAPRSHYLSQALSSVPITEDKTLNLTHQNYQIALSKDYGFELPMA